MKGLHATLIGIALLVSAPAWGLGTISAILPADPHALETVHATVTFPNGCPDVVDVRTVAGTTRIVAQDAPQGVACGQSVTHVDVALGAYAAGTQPLELGHFDGGTWVVDDRRHVVITRTANSLPLRTAPFPPFFADYSDLYWNPSAPGWGLQAVVHDSAGSATLTGFLYLYDANANPVWFVIVAPFELPGVFAGTVSRARGAPFGIGVTGFDLVPAGTVRIEFDTVRTGRLELVVDGMASTRRFERFRFR